MRFRFCGDLDAPDWLLAEIATLSRLTSVRIKLIVRQIVSFLVRGEISYEKVLKLTRETLGSTADTKGAIAGIHFILTNAAKYDVHENTLLQEIEQLGLPKENAEAISRQYRDAKEEIRVRLGEQSFRVSRLLATDWRVDQVLAPEPQPVVHVCLTVDTQPHREQESAPALAATGEDGEEAETAEPIDANAVIAAAAEGGVVPPGVIDGAKIKQIACEVDAEKFHVLLHELQRARDAMAALES